MFWNTEVLSIKVSKCWDNRSWESCGCCDSNWVRLDKKIGESRNWIEKPWGAGDSIKMNHQNVRLYDSDFTCLMLGYSNLLQESTSWTLISKAFVALLLQSFLCFAWGFLLYEVFTVVGQRLHKGLQLRSSFARKPQKLTFRRIF